MVLPTRRATRYARAWIRSPRDLVEVETTVDRGGVEVPASVARPAGVDRLPGWVVLHGMTRPGRDHEQLTRFMRTLAATGAAVIVPDVPEWRALHLRPGLTTPTVRAAIAGLRDTGWVDEGPVGIVGFSFGAPHAIAASGDPTLRDEIAGSVGFGGYCDLRDTIRFMMTGRSRNGDRRIAPDPYGRWIVGANYLGAVPDLDAEGRVARALSELATYSGDLGAPSWDRVYDRLIAELRRRLDEPERLLFDLLAPPAGTLPDASRAVEVADRLAEAALRTEPAIDPCPALARVERPVHILHGRGDRLIACAEAERIAACLPSGTPRRVTVTRLFGHSAQDPFPRWNAPGEVFRFFRALSEMLAVV